MPPAGGRLALASRAADGVSAGIPIVPVDPQLLQALVKSIVSCLGTAPGLPVSHFQQKATRSRHSLHSPHRPSLVLARARKNISRASVALAESAQRRVPHRKQEMTFSASKERRAGGCPGCRSTGLSPAQRWLPPHRSHRATLEDGAGCICSPTGRRSGNIPSRWAPGSISSKSPQSPSFEPRCHRPGGPFSYGGRKKGRKTNARAPEGRPGRCRSLEVLPSRSRPLAAF
jgi:hypothetical protein